MKGSHPISATSGKEGGVGVPLTLISLVVPDWIGLYVAVPIIFFGSFLVAGKVVTAAVLLDKLLLRSSHEDNDAGPPAKPAKVPNILRAVLAYVYGCTFVLVVMYDNVLQVSCDGQGLSHARLSHASHLRSRF